MEIPDDLELVTKTIFSYDRAEVDGTLPESVPASLALIRTFSHEAAYLVNSPFSESLPLLEPSPDRNELLSVLLEYLTEVARSITRAEVDFHLWFDE